MPIDVQIHLAIQCLGYSGNGASTVLTSASDEFSSEAIHKSRDRIFELYVAYGRNSSYEMDKMNELAFAKKSESNTVTSGLSL